MCLNNIRLKFSNLQYLNEIKKFEYRHGELFQMFCGIPNDNSQQFTTSTLELKLESKLELT